MSCVVNVIGKFIVLLPDFNNSKFIPPYRSNIISFNFLTPGSHV